MGIKDLFDKGLSLKSVKNKTQEKLAEDVESHKYIDVYSTRRDRFIPDVDFTTASNFAKFGLAEEYYDTAIKRIYQTYPYDGSQAEKIEWENNSTYLDLFLFENEYPRTNGFITFNSSSHTYTATKLGSVYSSSLPQYVYFQGGPHADPSGDYKSDFAAGPSKTGISKANIYHTASQRTNNLEMDMDKGVTVEFWMKKGGFAEASSIETIFMNTTTGSATNDSFLWIYTTPSLPNAIAVWARGEGAVDVLQNHDTGLSTVADDTWHHYAVTSKTYGSDTVVNLYVDGVHVSKQTATSTTLTAPTGSLSAGLGALPNGIVFIGTERYGAGWSNIVSSSFDEFRYWKTERDAQQIGRFYRDQIGGGTNTDNAKYNEIVNKVDLGVYYKFNEGITTDSTTDASILDYSGRISNGTFINYSSECRSTDSAIVISNAATKEFKDPIIYSNHPDVIALAASKQSTGREHDHNNVSSIYKSLPGWIAEEDEEKSNNLKYLTQILASYFDDLYLQIEKLPTLKDINYPDDNSYEKPLPFASRLLSSRGYDAPELFAGASDLAKYLERDEKKLFEKKLYEVKNIIYQNIYNNLSFIQKSKGTFKSLRNFLRCFGVDEELIKLNIYSVDGVHEFKNNETHGHIQKKYVDFDDAETRFAANGNYANIYTANAYQATSSTDSNSISYIPAATASLLTGAMMTIEAEVFFPKRSIVGDVNYQMFPSTESSLFGLHAVTASNTDMTFDTDDTVNFNVIVEKSDNDLRNAKFALKTTGSSVFTELENSTSFPAIYDNEKWNLAFRLRPTKARTDTNATLNTSVGYFEPADSAYTYELYGVNYVSNILQNEFTLSGTMSLSDAETFFTKPKRIFLGAARTNYTGSVTRHSDVKITSTRVWLDYLSDEVVRAHARNADSHGSLQPLRNTNDSLNSNYVPQASSLIMNWTMDNVVSSSATGQFLIEDFASGSTDDNKKFGDYWASPLSRYNYSGLGDNFVANSDQAVDIEFVQTAKQKLPEIANSDDMVKILNKQDDVVFTRDTTYVQHILSVEKSMYQTVSEEMLRMFATVVDFNNLVGEPVNRYRQHYKKLEKLRQLFFENVENEILDLEKFIEYFKWIDDAVTIMIMQLIPVSSNTVGLLRNMVESHVLERNKYWTKFPTLEGKVPELVSSISAIEELKYNWKFGHAPVSPDENTNQDINCLWWKQRAERDDVLSSGDSNIDDNKEVILKTTITEVSGSPVTLQTIAGSRYSRSYYHNRSLARPVDLVTHRSLKLKGGANPQNNKIHGFYKNIVKWGSDDDFIYVDVDNEVQQTVCNDQVTPPELQKKKFRVKALTMPATETTDSDAFGSFANDLKYTDADADLLLPFTMHSSSLTTGYQGQHSDDFKFGINALHEDKYGRDQEIPLQGPFTEKYVGGMQHRHVGLNLGTDTNATRPEGWHLEHFGTTAITDNILWENFSGASPGGSTDVSILAPPVGSTAGDPSPHERWRNGAGADHPWTFLDGATPSAGTGPASGQYAYCEVNPAYTGETFGLVTPLIDTLDLNVGSGVVALFFRYHMFGTHINELKVQASTDPTFPASATEDIIILSGQVQTADTDPFNVVFVDSEGNTSGLGIATGTKTLANFANKRFYIRFFYTAGALFLSDAAIDNVLVYKSHSPSTPGLWNQNSIKLLSPTHDNHNRPSAIYTRDTIAKRPVNIRNIQMSGNSPTIAGNYLNKYEYVNTTSPEANDPYFVKNIDQIPTSGPELLRSLPIQGLLSATPGIPRSLGTFIDYTLPDRSFLTGSTRNKTRIKTKFSSPGGFETLSRGFLDPEHETYSVYNAISYRNMSSRFVYNTQLQAHQGQYGVSTHGSGSASARVLGTGSMLEQTGSINALDYTLTGDAAKHKYHRNNIEQFGYTGDSPDSDSPGIFTKSSFDNAFVSHMIPRTDNQTRWITASLI